MLFSEAIVLYCESRDSQGMAHNTIRKDHRILLRIMAITGDMEVQSITSSHFDRVMADEAARGLSAGYLNGYQAIFSKFFQWLRERELVPINRNPTGGRRYRKVPVVQRDYIPMHDFPAFLDAAGSNPNTGHRDRAFVAAGLYLMLRASELVNLKVRDLDLLSGEVRVTIFKTNDSDIMPISSEFDEEMRKWLMVYSELAGPVQPDWYLFPAHRSIDWSTVALFPYNKISRPEDVIRRACKAFGFEATGPVGVHLLRRSSARAAFDELVTQGYDGALRRVQAWLHHARSEMTEKYLGLQQDRKLRNRDTAGKPLFPSLAATNVVPLRQQRERHG